MSKANPLMRVFFTEYLPVEAKWNDEHLAQILDQ